MYYQSDIQLDINSNQNNENISNQINELRIRDIIGLDKHYYTTFCCSLNFSMNHILDKIYSFNTELFKFIGEFMNTVFYMLSFAIRLSLILIFASFTNIISFLTYYSLGTISPFIDGDIRMMLIIESISIGTQHLVTTLTSTNRY